ncbi:MAG TPA: cupin domain-containing protein [Acidimicrobiales bacterium]|nr:cupin domain-containing protein [Acidimicrobiales bacterium]
MQAMRRVVTGQTADGKSVVVSDSHVEPTEVSLLPGYVFHRMWGSDAPPSLPTDGSPPGAPGYFPSADGYRFAFFTVGADAIAFPEDFDLAGALDELECKLPGLAGVMEPDQPGMHTTDTVDIDLVVSGEVWLELDDGVEVQLQAGDSVIQNGTRHAWHNRGTEPAVIFVALLGAHRG